MIATAIHPPALRRAQPASGRLQLTAGRAQPDLGRAQPGSGRKPKLVLLREESVWQPIGRGWQQLYGGFYDLGVSLEWHDFRTAQAFEWSRSFHPHSLELCLNLTGESTVTGAAGTLEFQPLSAGFYLPGSSRLQAVRPAGQQHRFLTVEFAAGFLQEHLAACDGALHPLVDQFLRHGPGPAGLGPRYRLTVEQEHLVVQLLQPPVPEGARPLWYRSKVLQLLLDFCFERPGEKEPGCSRSKRLARERVDRVIALLRQRLTEPPSLEAISRAVGCSPFHLSRTFSQETGMSIPLYLRKLRMERAAELLRSGKYNVTETALEVGYSSLSHFSQAFSEVIGCCPGLYPQRAPAPHLLAVAA